MFSSYVIELVSHVWLTFLCVVQTWFVSHYLDGCHSQINLRCECQHFGLFQVRKGQSVEVVIQTSMSRCQCGSELRRSILVPCLGWCERWDQITHRRLCSMNCWWRREGVLLQTQKVVCGWELSEVSLQRLISVVASRCILQRMSSVCMESSECIYRICSMLRATAWGFHQHSSNLLDHQFLSGLNTQFMHSFVMHIHMMSHFLVSNPLEVTFQELVSLAVALMTCD